MLERGVRGAATVMALGCCVVVVVLLLTVVAEGQARVGHPPGRASVGKGALAPVTFSYTGREQTYTVPAGVSSLQVQAVGANGGVPPGGTGGMVIGELSVGAGLAITPGEALYVAVGGTASGSNGGFNGGGNGIDGGSGGGGATDVRTCSPTSTSCANGVSSLLTRLIVAGGGGGAGVCQGARDNCAAGGSAGQPGGDPPGYNGAGHGWWRGHACGSRRRRKSLRFLRGGG